MSSHANDDLSGDDEAPSQELLNLIWDLSEGNLGDHDSERLNELLLQSPSNRAVYLQFMQLIDLVQHAEIDKTSINSDALLESLLSDSFDPAEVIQLPLRSAVTSARKRGSFVAVTCAGLAVLVGTLFVLVFVPHNRQPVARTDFAVDRAHVKNGSTPHQGAGDNLLKDPNAEYQDQLNELAQLSSGGP